MIKGHLRNLTIEWHIIWLTGLLVFAFVVGGASREGLTAHIYLFAFGWIGAGFLLALRYADLKRSVPKVPFILLALLTVWCLFTVLPLPAYWVGTNNSLYVNVLAEREALDYNKDWLTFSLTPKQTLRSLLSFGPSVFALLSVSLMEDKQRQNLLYGILLLGLTSIFLGLAQLFLGGDSALYFWKITNRGSAVGIFANANHQSIFAALLIPIVLVQASRYRRKFREGDRGLGFALLFMALFLIVVIGVMTGGSTAGYSLSVFAFILSVGLLRPSKNNSPKELGLIFITCLLLIILFIAYIYISPQLGGLDLRSFNGGDLSRRDTFTRSLNILRQNLITGTGLGSFVEVYPFFEDQENVSRTFMNHAHNDWLEWGVELGLIGLGLLLGFALWLSYYYFRLFLGVDNFLGRRISIAAGISVLVLVLHSLVDYPLRTPFLALTFFILLGVSVTQHKSIPNSGAKLKSIAKKHISL